MGLDSKNYPKKTEDWSYIIEHIESELRHHLGNEIVTKSFAIDYQDSAISTCFQDTEALNLAINFAVNPWISYFYSSESYGNYSEGGITEKMTLEDIIKESKTSLFNFLQNDTYRTDKFAGDRVVSSRLQTGNEITIENYTFRPFTRKREVQKIYTAPLKDLFKKKL